MMPDLLIAVSQISNRGMMEELSAPLLVASGAIPGALSRYYLTVFAAEKFGVSFPYGTLIINLTGSFLIGAAFTLLATRTDLQQLIMIGFLGAYTTFSTYALDTANLLQCGSYKAAFWYWFGSSALGFLCVELGIRLAVFL